MSKILLIILLIAGLVIGLYLLNQQTHLFSKAGTTSVPKKVQVSNISDNSFTVSWVTEIAVPGFVTFGKDESLGQAALDDRDRSSKNTRFTHHVTLKNLTPNTTYYFKIGSGANVYDKQGKPFTQTTAPTASDTPPLPETIMGKVVKPDGKVAAEALVYLEAEKNTLLSSYTRENGNFLITLNNARTADLAKYLNITDSTAINILVEAGPDGWVQQTVQGKDRASALSLTLLPVPEPKTAAVQPTPTATPIPEPTLASTPTPARIVVPTPTPAPIAARASVFITQILVSSDGNKYWYHSCPVNLDSGSLNCGAAATKWNFAGPVDLTNIRGLGNESYLSYGAYSFLNNGKWQAAESWLSRDGKIAWGRTCDVDLSTGLPKNCGKWTGDIKLTATGLDPNGFRSYGTYSWSSKEGWKAGQSLVSQDGKRAWGRICGINTADGSVTGCSSFSGPVDLTNEKDTNGNVLDKDGFSAYTAYSYQDQAGRWRVSQSIVSRDGKISWGRTCPLNADNGSLQCGSTATGWKWSGPIELSPVTGAGKGLKDTSGNILDRDGFSAYAAFGWTN